MIIKTILKAYERFKKSGITFIFSLILQPRVFINYCLLSFFKVSKDSRVNWHPAGAMFYINDTCNMECSFCGRMNGVFKKFSPSVIEDMKFIQFKKILDNLKEAMHVIFCGSGEPLLNNDLFKMIEHSKKNRKIVAITTNGIILDDKKAENILKNKVDIVVISIKSPKRENFSKITGIDEKYFDTVISNIKNLVRQRNETKSKTKININYVCSKNSIKDMGDMIELANNLGIDRLQFLTMRMANLQAVKNKDKLFFKNDRAVIEELERLKNKAKMQVIMPKPIEDNSRGGCNFAENFISVDACGNVSPCCGIPPYKKYGNIFAERDILNTKPFVYLRKVLAKKMIYTCLMCNESYLTKN